MSSATSRKLVMVFGGCWGAGEAMVVFCCLVGLVVYLFLSRSMLYTCACVCRWQWKEYDDY
jgi:hypothetical protein